jgi:hypothetical protein
LPKHRLRGRRFCLQRRREPITRSDTRPLVGRTNGGYERDYEVSPESGRSPKDICCLVCTGSIGTHPAFDVTFAALNIPLAAFNVALAAFNVALAPFDVALAPFDVALTAFT